MSDKLTPRQHEILVKADFKRQYTLAELAALVEPAPSPATMRREISGLCEAKIFLKSGDRKSTRYQLNPAGQLLAPLNAHSYCQIDIDLRAGNSTFNPDILHAAHPSLFSAAELSQLEDATLRFRKSGEGASAAICKRELERFAIELSWKSSKIEGNTYTLLDTELLLKEGISAANRMQAETQMILNHKRAFDYILADRADFSTPRLRSIQELHQLLVDEVGISRGLRARLIGITGSLYRPLQVPTQIKEALEATLEAVARLNDPYSKALTILAMISYIQPFEDGNKRTARLTANGTLLAAGCAPLSYRSINEISYREASLTFYEKNTIQPLKDLFFQQYMFACDNYLKFA